MNRFLKKCWEPGSNSSTGALLLHPFQKKKRGLKPVACSTDNTKTQKTLSGTFTSVKF